MNRYENGKIYKLVNNEDDKIYVGSTCLPLSKRLYGHRADAKRRPDKASYKHLNEIGWDNVQIVLIEEFACENKMELLKRERHFFDQLKPELNRNRPFITAEEEAERKRDYCKQYHNDHAEQLNLKKKEYSKDNKDALREKRMMKEECECGTMIAHGTIARHKKSKLHAELMQNE
jgi:hypothetical protein